jgi:YVTN family beta-propeller protein
MDFRILGPLEVEDDGRLLKLGGAKQRALLAVLLLHANEVVSRDRLIDELWGGSPPETASTALQVHVSQLRKVLGHDLIETRSRGYLLHVGDGELDLDRFERLVRRTGGEPPAEAAGRLREALSLWRGPPLADLGDAFAEPERARLEEERMSALELRIAADLDLGRSEELVPELEGLVREHPLRERLRGQLMVVLYRSGRQADALEVYRAGRRLLDEELGLQPGEELRRLERAILEQDPVLASPAAAEVVVEAEERRVRLSRRSRIVAAVGAVLLAGAVTAIVVALTRGAEGPVTVAPNSVAVIDSETNRVTGNILVGLRPVAIAVGEGAVWVANADEGTVQRIDPETRQVVATIGVGGEVSDLAVGYGSVWVAGGNDETLTRIDAQQNAVEARLTFGTLDALDPQPMFVVTSGAGAVWVTRGNRVLRVDPDTNEATDTIRVEQPRAIAVGAGALWVTTITERIVRIEPRTGSVTATIPVPSEAWGPAAGPAALWAIVDIGGGEIWRFDPNTGSPSGTVRTGDGPIDLALDGKRLWAANLRRPGSVSRIDAADGDVIDTISLGQPPTAVAAGEGAVWVAVESPAT